MEVCRINRSLVTGSLGVCSLGWVLCILLGSDKGLLDCPFRPEWGHNGKDAAFRPWSLGNWQAGRAIAQSYPACLAAVLSKQASLRLATARSREAETCRARAHQAECLGLTFGVWSQRTSCFAWEFCWICLSLPQWEVTALACHSPPLVLITELRLCCPGSDTPHAGRCSSWGKWVLLLRGNVPLWEPAWCRDTIGGWSLEGHPKLLLFKMEP